MTLFSLVKKLSPRMLCCCLFFSAQLHAAAEPGQIAEQQIRYFAQHFPGRMSGSPTERQAADYLQHYFQELGYQSQKRAFEIRYLYTAKNGEQSWLTRTATSVIAVKEGREPQQIIVIAHFDTYLPRHETDVERHLGGSTLQGVDDNASGVGVMLELATRLSPLATRYTVRFLALSAEEQGSQGAQHYLRHMSADEQNRTLLVINLDSLIVGDKLYFHRGNNTSPEMTKITRDRALALARRYGIPAATHSDTTQGNSCCSDGRIFDAAGLPVLSVEATNWSLGNKDGYQQRAISPAFPQGAIWHHNQWDSLEYLDRHLPGRIAQRSRESVRILLPLLQELAGVEQPDGESAAPPDR